MTQKEKINLSYNESSMGDAFVKLRHAIENLKSAIFNGVLVPICEPILRWLAKILRKFQ